ncbi:phosphatidylglycerophosphatase A family protein [Nitratifractor sp.]
MNLQRFFLSFGGTGKLPSPRIAASLVALLVGMALLLLLGPRSLFMLAFAFFLIGIFEIGKYEKTGGDRHDTAIVIDKVVGLWVALTVCAYGVTLIPSLPYALWIMAGTTLLFYALFESWAPSTIGWIRKEIGGGLGIMLDDILAGFAAGLSTLLLAKGAGALLNSL